MASQGELTYHKFIIKLQAKVASRFINGHDTQLLGRYFWGLLSEEFKEEAKATHGRNTFWSFAQFMKHRLINRALDYIIDLWHKQHFIRVT